MKILKIDYLNIYMNKEEIIKNFNQNENGLTYHGIFGLPFGVEESKMILVPIPWEATVSYHGGTAEGPKAILDASQQIDLYDQFNPNGWREGIAMEDIPTSIFFNSQHTKEKVNKYINKYVEGEIDKDLQNEINNDCKDFNNYVKEKTLDLINKGKIVGVVGGDHSVALGYLEALTEKYSDFGVLHIDAHADLRESYQGLEYSHASIFNNMLKIKNISKLVQIGIRDICEQEYELIKKEKNRISIFTDYDIKKFVFEGGILKKKYREIIKYLPKNVYISFDIDGLTPSLCPSTGTPVPGGFSMEEIVFLFEELVSSGRKIIGFDLCEVAANKENQWDGNVGARVLYKLCLAALKSQK
ncbi:MAG: agmatinase family protein [Candidatus Paceibacterota bacterium]